MATEKKTNKREIVNKRAEFEYFFDASFEAGVMLQGTEVKSVRIGGSVNLSDAYCVFKANELYVKNMHISAYRHGTHHNHEPIHDRKLLLRKLELRKLLKKVKERGATIVPYRFYFSDRGLLKLEIVLAQGKKSFDKRESIKEKDNKRQMDRLKKIKL